MQMSVRHCLAVLLSGSAFVVSAASAQITEVKAPPATTIIEVDAAKPANYRISRTIFGSFLEPIGNSTYNGLWAEILQNPSLESGLWSASNVERMVHDEPALV